MLIPFKSMFYGLLGFEPSSTESNASRQKYDLYNRHRIAQPKTHDFKRWNIDNMLAMNVIEPERKDCTLLVAFAPKKDETLRICVEYRKLNVVNIRNSYPLQRMNQCLEFLGYAQVFSTLDANSGYWQIEVEETDKAKTAFTYHHGVFQYNRLPFGLKIAPVIFQRVMDIILCFVR